MAVEETGVDGLLVVRWPTFEDERGFFRQTYQLHELTDALGREPRLVQGNHSRSAPRVLRGFHAEPWDKLVYVVRGTAMAAVADIRPESPTFGEVRTFLLGDAPRGEGVRLFMADGLANAFCVLEDGPADYLYEVGAYYRPGVDKRAVAWDDPDLGVVWPVDDPLLSAEDESNPMLRERYPSHPRFV